ncbi:hypothetical protein BC826DRAFT_1077857 [Russula brevipes]|nr:hypothetical protein BC826DRAFT_1077857 [Russula brevipes]
MLPEFTLITVCTWYTCRRTATTSAGRISRCSCGGSTQCPSHSTVRCHSVPRSYCI